GHAATCTIEPGFGSDSVTPTPSAKLPCDPGRKAEPRGDSRSGMHAAPFRVEHVVADDLDRAEALSQRIGDEGAGSVAGFPALDQRQPDVFLQGGRIADGGDVADALSEAFRSLLFDDMRAAGERAPIE